MTKRFSVWMLVVLLLLILLIGCTKKKTGVQPAVPVEVVKVTTGGMTESIDVVGSLLPKQQTDVKA